MFSSKKKKKKKKKKRVREELGASPCSLARRRLQVVGEKISHAPSQFCNMELWGGGDCEWVTVCKGVCSLPSVALAMQGKHLPLPLQVCELVVVVGFFFNRI